MHERCLHTDCKLPCVQSSQVKHTCNRYGPARMHRTNCPHTVSVLPHQPSLCRFSLTTYVTQYHSCRFLPLTRHYQLPAFEPCHKSAPPPPTPGPLSASP
jgi:hypothetical protein